MDERWVLRFAFLFFMPSFFLILSLWDPTVLPDTFNRSAISFVVLPCFTRSAIVISVGVRFKYLEDRLRENGEIMSSKLDSMILV